MSLLTLSGSRRGPRAAGFVLAALAIVGATYLASELRPATAPLRPAAPAVVAPGRAAPTDAAPLDAGSAPNVSLEQVDHSIAAWSKNLATNPHDYLAATNLAVLYQGRGRLSYDLSDYQRSLDAAGQALAIEPGDTEAQLAQASTLVSLHDFDKALTTADEHPRCRSWRASCARGPLRCRARARPDRRRPEGSGGTRVHRWTSDPDP